LRLNKLVKNYNTVDLNEPFKSNNVLPLNKNTLLSDDLINNIAGLQENLNCMSLKRLGKIQQYKRRKINLINKKESDDITADMKEELPELPLPINNNEAIIETDQTVEKQAPEIKHKIEQPTFTRPFMNHTNSSLILSPSPINVSFKNNNGFMMNRVITPLLKDQPNINVKKNHPLGDYEPLIKLNWSDNEKKENTSVTDNVNSKVDENLENKAYLKFLEKTPFKKWFNKEQDYNFNSITSDLRKNSYNIPPPPYTH